MKTLAIALALLATTTVTSAFAEGGADRLRERSDQWAVQRQQAQEAVAKRQAEQANRQADVPRTEAKPAS
ncbi:hypothetical protein HU719_007780 [Pseudomonas sp. SWRI107]|uniref:hypothetical protein n=1 Tax=Pseudomonas farsensis TaxID=2745492 RepID=UPI0016484915|nr:hypothetical protein [Pseudomonas farsensis]MBV4531302.1 hypothetical protein [Pseudomonas farsensis]